MLPVAGIACPVSVTPMFSSASQKAEMAPLRRLDLPDLAIDVTAALQYWTSVDARKRTRLPGLWA
ncbi:hypothetical protein GCM10010116_14760 [Microbispora rosea subsp. aerata]|nr:hypothetical protein GCM10010116_14760 [Microbispora rosea subsp. aerata]GIH53176.1 hypothetical protein Mro02_00900 [Microbispora rosea subsp. aerata]GLJ83912.1 hypothetical protein GCM10017588_26400 [Microbispora rosea subsp. aerata]